VSSPSGGRDRNNRIAESLTGLGLPDLRGLCIHCRIASRKSAAADVPLEQHVRVIGHQTVRNYVEFVTGEEW
jgi:hypothetical protein